eukprot:GEMP01019660.1.p1 GENE.GEMP01019660.1~~GEMP01019660.1.p1  ORF type:complete len:468 (+),score=112.19 GEMP01019660.1:63-1466(+)
MAKIEEVPCVITLLNGDSITMPLGAGVHEAKIRSGISLKQFYPRVVLIDENGTDFQKSVHDLNTALPAALWAINNEVGTLPIEKWHSIITETLAYATFHELIAMFHSISPETLRVASPDIYPHIYKLLNVYPSKPENCEEVLALLRGNVDINSVSQKGAFPLLHLAIAFNHQPIIQYCLDTHRRPQKGQFNPHKANLKLPGGVHRRTPLSAAVHHGRTEVVKEILEIDPTTVQCVDHKGPPLVQAIRKNREEIITLLLENQCDVNTRNEGKFSAVHYAVLKDDVSLVKKLCDMKADLSAVNVQGTSMFMKAQNMQMAEVLVEQHEIMAVNAANQRGRTAFVVHALQGHWDICELLVRKKANAHATTADGENALTLAVREKAPKDVIAKLISQYELDVNNVNTKNNWSCLCRAAVRGDAEIVEYLLEHKANAEHVDGRKKRALEEVAKMSNPLSVELLQVKNDASTQE